MYLMFMNENLCYCDVTRTKCIHQWRGTAAVGRVTNITTPAYNMTVWPLILRVLQQFNFTCFTRRERLLLFRLEWNTQDLKQTDNDLSAAGLKLAGAQQKLARVSMTKIACANGERSVPLLLLFYFL